MAGAKSYEIAKREVWQAYKRVKANGGAAGADGVSLKIAYSTRSRTPFRSDGGRHSAVMADTVPD
jgi:hypothetical protein